MKEHSLQPLPYKYDSLEPFIDEETMKIHHDKHHQAYCDNFNKALQSHPKLFKKKPEELLAGIENVPEEIRDAVRNNGGGFVNHSFFWSILKKNTKPKGEILEAINKKFGSIESFKEEFGKAASTRFGSGWAWLVLNNRELEIISTPNQDSPLSKGMTPLLTIDVWEHAYYLKYRNKRQEYIQNFFNVINWDKVNEIFVSSKK